MGFMNFDVVIKTIKMPSNCRHLCLYILLFSVVISFASADDQSDARIDSSNAVAPDHFGRPNYIQLKAKNNNRDLSEFSVRKPQTPHHHHHHQHHLRHQNSHNSEHRSRANGNHHHKQQHVHQSNDTALNRIPGYQRQVHSSKKHSHYDDNAAGSNAGGGFHTKNHALHHQHHNHQQQQRLTTLGPFRIRSNNRSGSWSSSSGETSNKRNWSDNLSKNRQAPVELTHSSMNRNKTPYHQYSPYIRSHHTTTKRTTTTTTTTTAAPDDYQEKVFFDAQNSFNNIDSDNDDDNDDDDFDYNNNDDDDEYSEDNYDTKKRSPSIGSFDRHQKPNQQSNENFQRDDPVRSTGYNGITTTNTFKSQHSSSNDNYQLNVNNDGSMNDNQATIETSKSFVEPNLTTRTGNRNEPGDLTREKFERLGNAEAVQRTFRQELPFNELKRLANAHANRVSREGLCKWPKPKLVLVGNHTSKTYMPHCTVLHRCSDETGCCHADYKTCQPRYKDNVTLAFWVHSKGQRFIEQLTFENHTECHCVSKIARLSYSDEPVTEVSTVTNRCRCPNHFTNVHRTLCKCDCASKQANDICNKLKTGLEHFSIAERRCITSEFCERPTCAYGDYDTKSGHCPREDEALNFGSNTLNDN